MVHEKNCKRKLYAFITKLGIDVPFIRCYAEESNVITVNAFLVGRLKWQRLQDEFDEYRSFHQSLDLKFIS